MTMTEIISIVAASGVGGGTLIAGVGYLIRQVGDAIVKRTDALLKREEAARLKADTENVDARAQATSAETVRSIAASMILKLENRVALFEAAHEKCLQQVASLHRKNEALETVVKNMADDLLAANAALAKETKRLAVVRSEYEQLRDDMMAGGGAELKKLPEPKPLDANAVDVVDLPKKTG